MKGQLPHPQYFGDWWSYVMADESQSEAIGREVRTLSNKQVELFDRLRDVEERLDMLLERIKKIEDTIKAPTRKR